MKIISLGFLVSILFSIQVLSYPTTPNPEWAEGSLCNKQDPDYSGVRYKEKIPYCERNVSISLKNEIYTLYKIPAKCKTRYTIDHIIPLSLGGDNSPENLWPEHKKIKATRPYLEMDLYGELKNGAIKQKQAIQIILKEKYKTTRPDYTSTKCD